MTEEALVDLLKEFREMTVGRQAYFGAQFYALCHAWGLDADKIIAQLEELE